MPPNPHYRPEKPDRNLSSTPTHTTSLSKSERLLVLRLCLFSAAWPLLIHEEQLKKQLYRFGYAINPPDNLKWPCEWLYEAGLPNGSLAEAIKTVRQLLSRMDALEPAAAPTPAPITGLQTLSPLFSEIPPETRNRVFELAVVREDSIEVPVDRHLFTYRFDHTQTLKERMRKSMPPPITHTCRLIRRETLPMFLGLNEFNFDPNYMDSHEVLEKWLCTMRPHLTSMNSLTFVLTSYVGAIHNSVIVNIGHNKARNCWAVTSMDDWNAKDPELQWALECDSELAWRLMATMVDQRSHADLTPEYLLWFIKDLKRIYHYTKSSLHHPGQRDYEDRGSRWFQEQALGRLPDVARPPDMYTTDLDEEFLGKVKKR
ncbi:hypothetical protein Q7P35_006713 [Cladosporium inversicolor]